MKPKYNIGDQVTIVDSHRLKNMYNYTYTIDTIITQNDIIYYKLYEQETGSTISYFNENEITNTNEIRECKINQILN